jgi:hypothetical protein
MRGVVRGEETENPSGSDPTRKTQKAEGEKKVSVPTPEEMDTLARFRDLVAEMADLSQTIINCRAKFHETMKNVHGWKAAARDASERLIKVREQFGSEFGHYRPVEPSVN